MILPHTLDNILPHPVSRLRRPSPTFHLKHHSAEISPWVTGRTTEMPSTNDKTLAGHARSRSVRLPRLMMKQASIISKRQSSNLNLPILPILRCKPRTAHLDPDPELDSIIPRTQSAAMLRIRLLLLPHKPVLQADRLLLRVDILPCSSPLANLIPSLSQRMVSTSRSPEHFYAVYDSIGRARKGSLESRKRWRYYVQLKFASVNQHLHLCKQSCILVSAENCADTRTSFGATGGQKAR